MTVEEADAEPAQKETLLKAASEGTVRSRSWTGQTLPYAEKTDGPWRGKQKAKPLGMPLQGLVTGDAIQKSYAQIRRCGWKCQKVAFNPVGQVIGQINHVERKLARW
ncbi:MAG: hypothetical protein IPK95_06975 [Cellvibrionales bacterium]|nr:hypothetical protein [Cellvibrionales bacterium]